MHAYNRFPVEKMSNGKVSKKKMGYGNKKTKNSLAVGGRKKWFKINVCQLGPENL